MASLPSRPRGMACAAVVAALALAPATASAMFQPLGNLSGSSLQSTDPAVAVAGNGDVVAIWTRSDTFNDRVQFQLHRAGEPWSSAEYVSPAALDAAQARVALDANGDATIAWLRDDGSHWVVETRTRSAGGSWSAIQRLSAAGEDASDLRVDVAPDGTAAFSWRRAVGPSERVQSRTRTAGGTLGSVANLSPGGADAFDPEVAIDGGGGVVVAWTRSDGGHGRVQARRREADGSVGAPLTLSPTGTDGDGPDVDIDAGGNAIVVWRQSGGAGWRALLRTVSPAGGLGALETLSASGRDLRDPHVAVDGAGTAVATWRRFDGSNWRVQVVARAGDGSLSARHGMSPAGADALEPDVAVESGGRALVAWRRLSSGHWVFESRERLPDGSVTGLRGHSDGTQDAFDPRIAMGPNGTAVLLWRPVGGQNGYALRARVRIPDGHYLPVDWLSSTRHSAREARVASNADGDAVFAWRRLDVTGWRLEARRRAPDGTLGPVVEIGPAVLDEAHLRVAIDPAGNVLFVWQRFVENSAYPGVLARAWPAGADLGPT